MNGDDYAWTIVRICRIIMDHLEQTSKLAFEAYNAARYVDAEALCQTLLQIKPDDAQILLDRKSVV